MNAVVQISFPVKHIIWVGLAALLTACGGGGSEASAPGANGSAQQPPSLYVPEPGTARVGELYTLQLSASDVNGDTLTFSVEGKPSWSTFDEKKGTLSGRPGNSDSGRSHNVRFGVSDGSSLTESDPVVIVVEPVDETPPPEPNQAPSISGSPATTVTVGNPYRFQAQASDPEGDSLTFAIQNLPNWASFNGATGVLSGTPGSAAVGTTSGIEISVSDGEFTASLAPFSIQVNAEVTVNTAPVIGGTPATSVAEGSAYGYTPIASDADGDTLSFSIQNLPIWANFNSATGTLSGVPSNLHVGLYTNILISVSDGQVTTAGAAFSIDVTQVATGNATLSWTAPTENMDGSALTDLAGYKLYYGMQEGQYTEQIQIDNPGIVTYVVENLSPNTYYFVATALNSSGVESPFSGVAVKVVN